GGHAATAAAEPVAQSDAEVPTQVAADASNARTDLVAVRRRGAGTDLAPNA
ncbi:biotin synthase BioB, partial [Streptomyces sp. NPDC047981]